MKEALDNIIAQIREAFHKIIARIKAFLKIETIDPTAEIWREVVVIDLSKPYNKINSKFVTVMDILDREATRGRIQWRMNRDGDLAAFEAFCTGAEFQHIQEVFGACI